MSGSSDGGWAIWISLVLGLILAVMPMPVFIETGRPLWLAMILAYWVLYAPLQVGLMTAWISGLGMDILHGSLLGQNALVLVVTVFLVQLLQQRLRAFPLWQQSLIILLVLGLTQLIQLWLYVLAGNRPPSTLLFLLPVLVSALLWPWLFAILRSIRLAARVS